MLDHILVIDYDLSKKKHIYCGFIDYKKAFDLIDRRFLWSKLITSNIIGKVLNVIH